MSIPPLKGPSSAPLLTRTREVLEQKTRQRPELENLDRTRLSEELVEEVQRSTPGSGSMEGWLEAMAENFSDRKASEARGAESAKKVEVEWLPEVRAGEVMPPQGYTGQLVYRETPAPGARPSASDRPKSARQDRTELSAESTQRSQQMQRSGMQARGLEKALEQKGDKPEERVDVHMPALGMTQLVDVTPAGTLGRNQLLGTYRKLDDMPAWNGAILRKRTGKEWVEDHQRRLQRGEAVPEWSRDQLEKLKNPVASEAS